MYSDYILPFLAGGSFIALNKYMSNNISPKLGAILVTFPIGLLSAYFIISDNKQPMYLKHYIYMALLNVSIGAVTLYLITTTAMKKKVVFGLALLLWVIFSIIQLFISL